MVNLKEIFEEYNSLPKSPQRSNLSRKIRKVKQSFIKKLDYVGIIDMLRYLGDYEKDDLLWDLLNNHNDASLFVLAFSTSGMHSYDRAYMMEKDDHDEDEEALRNDVQLLFDEKLCAFLSEHQLKEDLTYVQELTDGATWLESHKRSMRGLL
jgi:hypothetical protein